MLPTSVSVGDISQVGAAAIDGRIAEVGVRGSTLAPSSTVSGELTEEYLQHLEDFVRELVGGEFDWLMLRDANGQASQTPPLKRNPLARVVDQLRRARSTFSTEAPIVDARALAELHILRHVVERWSGHPQFASLRDAIANEYPHTLITLALASYLEDMGNGVMVGVPAAGRSPDLRIQVSAMLSASVEVKSPDLLYCRDAPLPPEAASSLIQRALRKIGSGRSGQLSGAPTGLLVLGGFHLTSADLDELEGAACDRLGTLAQRSRKPSLAAIYVVSIGSALRMADGIKSFHGEISVRAVPHPGYAGEIRLATKI
ncbi:MAG: hypothetical protein ACYC2K_18185 [Gemmatimonadales bacterium]